MILGKIEEGKLKGKKVILEPRSGLKENEYLVEKGLFLNGSPQFSLHCLNKGCECEIPGKCDKCNKNQTKL